MLRWFEGNPLSKSSMRTVLKGILRQKVQYVTFGEHTAACRAFRAKNEHTAILTEDYRPFPD